MVLMGFRPAQAAAVVLVGHAWAVTFGSLGSSYYTIQLVTGIEAIHRGACVPICLPREGHMFSIFFCETPPRNFDDVMATDKEMFPPFFGKMLEAGIYLPPSPFETSFLSIAHDDAAIERILDAWEQSIV